MGSMSNSRFNYAMDFLLYSYFTVTMNDKADIILEAAIRRAYRDASSHVLSVRDCKTDTDNRIKEKLQKEYKKECGSGKTLKEALKEIGTAYIFNAVHELVNGKQKSYKEFHKSLCTRLFELYNCDAYYESSDRKFSYGIAQKWVNMSIKYIFIIYSLDVSKSFTGKYGKIIEDFKKDFHVPADSYIYKAAEKGTGETICKDKNVKGLGIRRSGFEYEGIQYKLSESWSKIDNYNDYLAYQQAISRKINEEKEWGCPIEWESAAWIAQAASKQENEMRKE